MKTRYALPNEIQENILSRLPVKTILRFMSVCKSWYSLFLDPYFINLHGKNTSNNLLLMRLADNNDIVVKSSSSSKDRCLLFNDGFHCIERKIVGSCNGIVCVYSIPHLRGIDRTFDYYIYLWNPAMKIIKIVMKGVDLIYNDDVSVGFGFHNNDYKVIRFRNSTTTQVEIYSLFSDSLRTVNISPPPCYSRHYLSNESCLSPSVGVFVNGAYHWAVLVEEIGTIYPMNISSAIISFEMGEEVFKEIPIPGECVKNYVTLFNYNESLAMILALPTTPNTNFSHCIWVMKKYGLPDSWTKLCNIDIPQQQTQLYFRGIIQPQNELFLSRYIDHVKEEFIVFDIDKLAVKDISSSITNIEVPNDVIQITTYRESLLFLNSPNLIRLL